MQVEGTGALHVQLYLQKTTCCIIFWLQNNLSCNTAGLQASSHFAFCATKYLHINLQSVLPFTSHQRLGYPGLIGVVDETHTGRNKKSCTSAGRSLAMCSMSHAANTVLRETLCCTLLATSLQPDILCAMPHTSCAPLQRTASHGNQPKPPDTVHKHATILPKYSAHTWPAVP